MLGYFINNKVKQESRRKKFSLQNNQLKLFKIGAIKILALFRPFGSLYLPLIVVIMELKSKSWILHPSVVDFRKLMVGRANTYFEQREQCENEENELFCKSRRGQPGGGGLFVLFG